MHKDIDNKKLYITLAIMFLLIGIMQGGFFLILSWDDTAILPIFHIVSAVILLVCSAVFFIRFFSCKKAKTDFPVIDSPMIDSSASYFLEIELFNQLEKDLLDAKEIQTIYDIATKWLLENQNASYVACSLITEDKNLNIKAYFEASPSLEVFSAMVMMRTEQIDSGKILPHDSGGFSIPFFKKGAIAGFLFLGMSQTNKTYTKSDYEKLNPFIRILSTALLVADVVKIKKEKNQLQYAFSRYISPDMVDKILHDPDVLKLGGEKQNLSVIFTDLRDFTQLSDEMDPIGLVRVLNMYLNEMSEVIIALGGTIDKFEGDAILAFFGAPTPLENHAVLCCRAAVRMKKMEQILNGQLLAEKLITTPLFTRFGINTGEMIVGNIGSLKRLDYTIIGSNVNLASRIETANKDYDTSILVSDQTWRIVKDDFEGRYVDTVQLKGVKRPVPLFELLAEKVTEDVARSYLVNDIAKLMDIDVQGLFGSDASDSTLDAEDLAELEEIE